MYVCSSHAYITTTTAIMIAATRMSATTTATVQYGSGATVGLGRAAILTACSQEDRNHFMYIAAVAILKSEVKHYSRPCHSSCSHFPYYHNVVHHFS